MSDGLGLYLTFERTWPGNIFTSFSGRIVLEAAFASISKMRIFSQNRGPKVILFHASQSLFVYFQSSIFTSSEKFNKNFPIRSIFAGRIYRTFIPRERLYSRRGRFYQLTRREYHYKAARVGECPILFLSSIFFILCANIVSLKFSQTTLKYFKVSQKMFLTFLKVL